MSAAAVLQASFAGSCYPEDPQDLLAQFQEALSCAPKPKNASRKSSAYIVPHIDFRVNLSIYAEVYRMIAERRSFPDLFLILGVGHRCPHEFSLCPFSFRTPLGQTDTDQKLLQLIRKDCPFPLSLSPATFRNEHSLEFVIVWLQAIRDLTAPGKPFQILPVLMGGLHEPLSTGQLPGPGSEFFHFGRTLKKHLEKKDSVIIVSIDGCHVGPRFDHEFPGNAKAQRYVKKWKKELWSCCSSARLAEFFQHAARIQNGFYFDGLGVLSLLLQHFDLNAIITSRDLWYEESDQSFVTFSGGWFDKTSPAGTQ